MNGELALPEDEARPLLVDWNATQRAYPRDSCIHELFEAVVDRTPDVQHVVPAPGTRSGR